MVWLEEEINDYLINCIEYHQALLSTNINYHKILYKSNGVYMYVIFTLCISITTI